MPAGAGAQTRDLLCARQGSPAAPELFRQVSLFVAIDRLGRRRNTMCGVFWR